MSWLPKTKPVNVDVLDWWDKTIEMCTKRADGIEMCIDDLATAVREQRQTIEELRLSLKMERNSTVERLLTDEKELALVEAAAREYGLPDLPKTAYAQEYSGRWGVWVHALPFCISLALSCESKEAAVAHAQGDWKGLLARHPEYAGQDPIIVQLQPTVPRSWRARAILASHRLLEWLHLP